MLAALKFEIGSMETPTRPATDRLDGLARSEQPKAPVVP